MHRLTASCAAFTAFVFELPQHRHTSSGEHSLMRSLTMDLGKLPVLPNGAASASASPSASASASPSASSSSPVAHGGGVRRDQMPPPAARRKPRYFTVDEQALIRNGARVLPAAEPSNGATLLRLARPHVADTSPSAEQLYVFISFSFAFLIFDILLLPASFLFVLV